MITAIHLLRAAVMRKTAAMKKTSAATPSDYVVRRGDTLGGIAKRHGTTVDALSGLNAITDPNRIAAGQRLRLVPAAAAKPAPAPVTTPPAPAVTPPAPAVTPPAPAVTPPAPAAKTRAPATAPQGALQEVAVPQGEEWTPEARRAVQAASRRGRLFPEAYPAIPTEITPAGLSEFVGRWEGFRSRPYRDSRGLLTVGYGTLLDGNPENQRWLAAQGGRVTPAAAAQRKQEDLAGFIDVARRNQPGFDKLPPAAQAIVVDLNYNLGPRGYLEFRNARTALAAGDWDRAADELIDSRWFAQTGNRAKHHVDVLRSLARAQR